MIEVELNNVRYTGFTSVTFNRDIETLCADFSIDVTTLDRGNFPVKRGEACKIFIDEEKILTGYVDTINVSYDPGSHSVSVSGRDRTEDLVDSTVDSSLEIKTPVSLDGIINAVLRFLSLTDIKVINQVKDLESFSSLDKASGEIGKKAFDFIHDFCAKRQVLLTSNADGNLVITRGEGIKTKATLINKIGGLSNNVKSASVSYDDTKRYNRYIMRSQPDTTAITDDESGFSIPAVSGVKGESVDKTVRVGRIIVLNAEKVSSSGDVKDRAKWEQDMRNARAISYKPTVQGHRHGGNSGLLWQPLQIVTVVDEFCGVDDQLIIRSVSFKNSMTDGNITILELVPKDTYQLFESEGSKKKKNGKGGKPPTQAEINQVKYELQ